MANIYGCDFIGGGNYIDVIEQTFKKDFAIGVLISADGWRARKAWKVVKKAAKFGECPIIKVISRWEDDHQFNEGHIKRAVKHLEKLNELASEYPSQEFWFNPFLEYRADKEVIKKLNRNLKRIKADNVTLVYNPEHTGYYYPSGNSSILELHNQHFKNVIGKRQSFSFDGQSSVDSNITKRLKDVDNCEACFLWIEEYNGYSSGKHKPDRPNRTEWPDKKLIKSVRKQVTKEKGETNFPSDMLFKTHGEHTNKIVVQIKNKGDYIYLKVGEDTLIRSAKGYYSENNQAYIYRFDKMGIDIKADLVDVYLDSTFLGAVNPIFRDGYYRF